MTDVFGVIVFSIGVVEISLFIDRKLDNRMDWLDDPQKRIVIQPLFQIIGSLVIVIFLYFLFIFVFSQTINEGFVKMSVCIATNVIVSLFISGINTTNFILSKWLEAATEATKLKLEASEHQQAAVVAELQALKLQIDPHFIFNNLSVLAELILENQRLGYDFTEHFAKVYRYMLVNSQKDYIELEEEVKFLTSYIYMIKKRIGDGVKFEILIDGKFNSKKIPPMVLQFLVENAIKHNQTSKKRPLKILIKSIDNDLLIVENEVIPLVTENETSGFGLKNIIKRYELLGDPAPIIEKKQNMFKIIIPLL